jgi:hypothetical protein
LSNFIPRYIFGFGYPLINQRIDQAKKVLSKRPGRLDQHIAAANTYAGKRGAGMEVCHEDTRVSATMLQETCADTIL